MKQTDDSYTTNKPYAFHGWKPYTGNKTGREAIWEWQAGRCAICDYTDKEWPPRVNVVLDHDHKNTKIRGYLCRSCNVSEGAGNLLYERWRNGDTVAALMGVDAVYMTFYGPAKPEPDVEELELDQIAQFLAE